MRSRPKSQVRFPPPVFQVVPRFKSRLRPVRNLVVMIPRRPQRFLRHLIKLRHLIFARHRSGAVLPPALQQLLAEPAALINLQQIDRNVLRPHRRQFFQRSPPAFLRLVRQPCNQIKADIPYPRLAQNRHRPINVRPAMHPPRCRFYFVGAQHRCALRHRPNSQPNPLPPPSGTPYVHESPCIAPPRMAQTCYSPPLRYENYNRYTSSGRTAPARKSRASSSPKNSSTPLPQPATRPDTPNGTMGA